MPEFPLEATIPEARREYWVRHTKRLAWAIAVLVVVYGLVFVYTRWSDPDREFKLVNFASAWFPFGIGVLAVFVPDLEKFERMRMRWRAAVFLATLAYSALLWFQQGVNLRATREDQSRAVNTAVDKSNQHSDKSISDVREVLSDKVQKVQEHTDTQIASVNKTVSKMADQLSKSFSDVDSSIGRVGKPDPLPRVKLNFSRAAMNTEPIAPDKDGVYSVELTVTNDSPTAGHELDVWIDLCGVCIYVRESGLFDRPVGLRDGTRHFLIALLNPHTSITTQTIALKVPFPAPNFSVGMRYSCEACVDSAAEQIISIPIKQ